MSTVEVKTVQLQELSYTDDLIIDVRSPKEFEEYRIPNAVSIPLFSNEERAKVGTYYKQKGKEAAVDLGMELFGTKVSAIYQKVKQLNQAHPNRRVVIYCWRGGMRSRTVTGMLGLVGINSYQLVGGIRSFRQYVQRQLEVVGKQERRFIVIEGHTGTGKTELLHRLASEGYPVLDLEGLAGHRGSIFGHIGLQPQSQKQFEYELINRLTELRDEKVLIIEGESKRIGRIVLPPFLLEGKENGVRIELRYPFWSRVEHIYETYKPEKNEEQIKEALHKLAKFLTKELKEELEVLLAEKKYKLLFARLLEHYYDPKYEYTSKKYKGNAQIIEFQTFDEGFKKLKENINRSITFSSSQ